jgi:hypothetical protein
MVPASGGHVAEEKSVNIARRERKKERKKGKTALTIKIVCEYKLCYN